jgi:hypothetical protein
MVDDLCGLGRGFVVQFIICRDFANDLECTLWDGQT